MGRSSSFNESIQNYLGGPEVPTEPTDDFDLPSDREAYYKGLGVGLEKSVEVQKARKEAAKAARVAQPKPPRQPRPVNPVVKAQKRAARIGKLARLASGKKR